MCVDYACVCVVCACRRPVASRDVITFSTFFYLPYTVWAIDRLMSDASSWTYSCSSQMTPETLTGHVTVAIINLSSVILQHSTSSIREGSLEMVITELVPTKVDPVVSAFALACCIHWPKGVLAHLPRFRPDYSLQTLLRLSLSLGLAEVHRPSGIHFASRKSTRARDRAKAVVSLPSSSSCAQTGLRDPEVRQCWVAPRADPASSSYRQMIVSGGPKANEVSDSRDDQGVHVAFPAEVRELVSIPGR